LCIFLTIHSKIHQFIYLGSSSVFTEDHLRNIITSAVCDKVVCTLCQISWRSNQCGSDVWNMCCRCNRIELLTGFWWESKRQETTGRSVRSFELSIETSGSSRMVGCRLDYSGSG